ncbi:MAG: DUF2764 family protein [Marinilabiliales bacterium]|nr:MAG: DUF2764 family protein [Marinilabiliales bacterium]
MFERNYYYLVAGLPEILIDQKKLNFSIADFKEDMEYHLHPDDFGLVELLFLPADNKNLLNLLMKTGGEFDNSGKYSQEELEEEIREPSAAPEYMQQFITAYKSGNSVFDGLSWEDQLTWLFYEYLLQCPNAYLREWFDFDLNLRNIVAGFNVRKHKLEGDKFFIGDNSIVQAVKKSTLKDFGLVNDFGPMEKLVAIHENENLLEREIAMDKLRWEFMDELNTFNYFTIEVLLAFVKKLQMINRWLDMDYETGKEMFTKLLDQLQQSYEFPKEFSVKQVN